MYDLYINNIKILKINAFRERLEPASLDSDKINVVFSGKGLMSENENFEIDSMKNYLLGDNVYLIEIKDTEKVYFKSDKYRNFNIIWNFLDEEDGIFKIEIVSYRS